MNRQSKGRLVVVDGLGKSGKTSICRRLEKRLSPESTLFTREPGGTLLAEEIRRILMRGEIKLSPLTHVLLFFATRRAHIEEVILPALSQGKNVICARFDSSTDAYNLWGENAHHLRWLFRALREQVVSSEVNPFYIILDVEPRTAYERHLATREGAEPDQFDDQDVSFYERVQRGFLEFASQHHSEIVDANCSLDELEERVLAVVNHILT